MFSTLKLCTYSLIQNIVYLLRKFFFKEYNKLNSPIPIQERQGFGKKKKQMKIFKQNQKKIEQMEIELIINLFLFSFPLSLSFSYYYSNWEF